jgi:TatD DNase family protein
MQRQLLAAEVRIAREKSLPLMVHSRESHDDILAILKDEGEGEIAGAIHGFSGDSAVLRDWLDLGFFISLGRGLFRPDSEPLLATIKDIPQDRLLIETDAVPGYSVAGESPEPAGVKAVADKIGEAMGISGDKIGEIATENLKALLNL